MTRRALVTGGNRGIGKAIAAGLAGAGFEVAIGVRDIDAGRAAAEEIGAEAVLLDLEDIGRIETRVAEIGGVDVLVNNAGVLWERPLLENPRDFEASMRIMVHAPYHLTRLLLPGMGDRGWGRIVNLSSGWGSFAEGLGGPGAYGVAKAALNALTVATARAAPAGVKINAACPGWVRTRMGGDGAPRSVEEGAETPLWLATLPEDGPTGGFFRRRERIEW